MIRRYRSARMKRKVRVRSKVKGTADRPRLSVFRSNRAIYAQLIDDQQGQTLIAANEKELEQKSSKSQAKTERAKMVGNLLAKRAIKKRIKKAVFDRGSYLYHGRVKALAEAARKAGLEF
ncbi:MAG TPA: 50S ribosomal protein L18 [Candidatus Bathyarchaeia archaeon]|nr:50S ribosomal protein L18 [Candidatus Bathyarchaeia archaeon]